MTATPAQIDYITKLREGWDTYLANQQAADTSDAALFEWLKASVPTNVVRWYCERENIAAPVKPKGSNPAMNGRFGSKPVLTQEEWDTQHAAYLAEMERIEPVATEAYIAHVAYNARAWAFAMTVDTSVLSKQEASAAIDILKNH